MDFVIQVLVKEVQPLLSEWRSRGGNLDPDDATDLLSSWAHLQRLAPEQRPADLFEELDNVIRSRSFTFWENAVVSTLDPQAWREALLERVDDHDDLSSRCGRMAHFIEARRLLDELDQAELASWAVRKLHRGGPSEVLERLHDDLSECLFVLEEEIHVFKELNSYAIRLRKAYREDLLAFDAGLWWTVAKFDLIADYAALSQLCGS